jgi:hypothetical protein
MTASMPGPSREAVRAAFASFLASQGYDDQDRFDQDEMELAFETGMLVQAGAPVAPQSARADEFARVKVRLCALVDSLDKSAGHGGADAEEFDRGAGHASAVTATQLRAILDETALAAGGTAEPAASADRELLGRLRSDLGYVCREASDPHVRARADEALTALREAGIE